MAESAEQAIVDMVAAQGMGADLVELRVDALHDGEAWERVVAARTLPVIVTCRPVWEGGLCHLPEEERLRVLERAVECGVEYVDVELAAMDRFRMPRNGRSTRLIVSHHCYGRALTAQELVEVQAAIIAAGADACKIAFMCSDVCDNAAIFDVLQRSAAANSLPTIVLGMGEHGQLSRLLAGKFGPALLTFTAVDARRASAPGQLLTRELVSVYRFKQLNVDTEVYGIIGSPVAHSMSPLVHNRAFGALQMNRVYVPILVSDGERLGEFFQRMLRYGMRGFSVTIPHKERALKLMDEVDAAAADIGAINTVVVDARTGRMRGSNTDWEAAVSAIEEALQQRPQPPLPSTAAESAAVPWHTLGEPDPEPMSAWAERVPTEPPNWYQSNPLVPLHGKRVVLVGAGGAARAIAYGVLHRQCETLLLVNRTRERAEALMRDLVALGHLNVLVVSWDDFLAQRLPEELDIDSIDVLINSTAIGMHPREHETPVPPELLRPHMLVFDAVYNPLETRLLRDAQRIGCATVSGLEMFVRQAVLQFKAWTGCRAPAEKMRAAVLERLRAPAPV